MRTDILSVTDVRKGLPALELPPKIVTHWFHIKSYPSLGCSPARKCRICSQWQFPAVSVPIFFCVGRASGS